MPKKSIVEIGNRYGHLTVIGEKEKNSNGQRVFEYRCDCGNIGKSISSFLLRGNGIRCRKCTERENGLGRRVDMRGKIINGWEILKDAGRNEHGQFLFLCRCIRCGTEKVKTGGTVRHIKSSRCMECPPVYHFVFQDGYAVGKLPDGTEFIVDEDKMPYIEKIHWRKNSKGYIISGGRNRLKIYLHRFIMGVDADITVDHINRVKTDCRKANLRICSTQQNCCNKSLQKNNSTGYVGVSYIPTRRVYYSRIEYCNRDIKLGSYKDIVKAAQAHNIAAESLFGEYMGHINEVPVPEILFAGQITDKCKQYMNR